jgi:hypothetical protein
MRVVQIEQRGIWYPESYHDDTGPETDIVHIAQKFEHLLDVYRHPDGRKWTGAELEKATGGV